MYFAALLALAPLAAAQSTTAAAQLPQSISPEQSSRILSDFSSYNSYLAGNKYISSLGQAINTWLPVGSWDNWNAEGFHNMPKTTDYLAIATATPTYSYPSWATGIPGSLQSEWGAFATSVQVARESIVRNALGIQSAAGLPATDAAVVQGPTPTANNITVNTVQTAGAMPTAAAGQVALGAVAGLAAIMGLAL